MRSRSRAARLLTLVVLLVGLAAAAPRAAPSRVGTLGEGAWSWFGDPRAVTVSDPRPETVVGYIDWSGAVTVAAVDPRFGVLRRAVVGRVYHDDHSDPSLFVEADGRVTAFWSSHNGAQMYFRTTLAPGDIGAWGPRQQLPLRLAGHLGFTYPNPEALSAEHDRLYLMWRGADWSADYATREPDGSWSGAHRLIVAPGQRPYVKVDSDGRDTIGLAFTDGHPRNVLSSIYFAEYRHGWLRGASGRPIARLGRAAVSPARADRVYDAHATHIPAWIWDTALGSGGRPVIVYATFPSVADHEYWYARWNGRRWVSHRLADAGASISPRTIEYEYSGGITLDHSDPAIVYLSRQVGRGWELERWSTPDGGDHWRHRVVVPAAGGNFRPVVPRGSPAAGLSLLWVHGDYRTYTTYRTTIEFLR